jgi:hypothetical protein
MSFIEVVNWNNADTPDRISILWNTMLLIRKMNEEPQLWKLTDPFIDAIANFMSTPKEKIYISTFLDISVDITSANPGVICVKCWYPLIQQ